MELEELEAYLDLDLPQGMLYLGFRKHYIGKFNLSLARHMLALDW